MNLMNKKTGFFALTVVLVFMIVSIGSMVAASDRTITLTDNGVTTEYTTDATTVGEFLEEKKIVLGEEDMVVPAEDTMLSETDEVAIYRAVNITVLADGAVYNLFVAAPSALEAAKKITDVSVNDTVLPSPKALLTEGMEIEVRRAKSIEFTLYGQSVDIVTSEETVGEFLEARGIVPGENDVVTPGLETSVREGMKLDITCREVVTEVRNAEIPYEAKTKTNASLEPGTSRVVQAGVKGNKEQTVEVVYENGVEVKSTILSETVTREAVDEITEVSSKKEGFSYSRVITCTATAYDASPACNGKWAGMTATGLPLEHGMVAVDPRVIPLRSRLYIEAVDGSWTYGYAVAGDTGGAIKGNKVDLFMASYSDCMQFGRRQCRVYILD